MSKLLLSSSLLLACLLSAAALAAEFSLPPEMPDTTPPGKPRFDSRGAKRGDQLPNLPMVALDGKPTSLENAWKDSPTLLLTMSYTCPKSRSAYPSAADLAKRVANRGVRAAIVYVIEAHPAGDPSPYSNAEDVTAENRRDQILCRQPTNIAERVKLAGEFAKRMKISIPIFIDQMDNEAWKQLGGGPNMGVLVNSEGIVLARQGWFDARSMGKAIDALAAAAPATQPATRPTEAEFKRQSTLSNLVRHGDIDKLKILLDADPAIERGFPIDGDTLLQEAAQAGQIEVIEFLLKRGADINRQSERSPSPLHLALSRRRFDVAEYLLEHGADPNAKAHGYGPTPLQEEFFKYTEGVPAKGLLAKYGAKPNFYTAAATGDLKEIQRAYLADMTILLRPDGAGRTALAYAAVAGNFESAKLLVSLGAKDVGGVAASCAVQGQNLEMTQFLLDHGSDPHLLRSAIDDRRPIDIVRVLLDHKANPNGTGEIGPLHLAAGYGRADIANLLLDKGADINAPATESNGLMCGPAYFKGDAPLHVATQNGYYEVAELLLKRGAKANVVNRDRETPLHLAMHGLHNGKRCELAQRLVKELIALKVDINAKDVEGQTALDLAVPNKNEIFTGSEEEEKKQQSVLAGTVALLKKAGAVNGTLQKQR